MEFRETYTEYIWPCAIAALLPYDCLNFNDCVRPQHNFIKKM